MICDHPKIHDTAIEPEETVLENGELSVDLTVIELEFCPICGVTEYQEVHHE